MTNNVQPIRKHSISEECAVMRKLVSMAEGMLPIAKTPGQQRRMEQRLEKMRGKLAAHEARAARVEAGYE